MGKKSRTKGTTTAAAPGEVGPRQPCPCGSGRRYKACHGATGGPAPVFVRRPFEGLKGECDIVALRELVPAASAPVSVKGTDREVVLCSLLPMAAPALVRDSGAIWVGLQVQHGFGDPSRDLAAVIEKALEAANGEMVGLTGPPGDGPRLQDLLEDEPLVVTVHEGFDFWVADVDEPGSSASAALDQASASMTPTRRLASVEAAYWVDVGSKEHLRWVLPYDEDPLLDALARLHASGQDDLVDGSRFVGMFRAHGLLTPVWDLAVGTGADVLEEAVARVGKALEAALAEATPLSAAERAARSGLANRQVTLR